jgi:hypothetical protein
MVWLSTLGASAYIYFRTGNFQFALGGAALGLLIYSVFVFMLHRSVFRREGTSAADLFTPQVIGEKAVMGTLIPLVTAFILVWRWG